jgi:hypothetical protein
MRSLLIVGVAGLQIACSTHLEIHSDSSDTYHSAVRATWDRGGSVAATQRAVQQARNYCGKQTETLQLVSFSDRYSPITMGDTVYLYFRCQSAPNPP